MPGLVIRNRLTWLMYAVNGVSAYFVYSVGPATPLIADDLGIPPQSAALHGTAMAAALLTTGALATPAITRWGRGGTIAGAMVVMSVGVLGVTLAPVLAVSLLGAYLAGLGGAVAAVAANATLAATHPQVAPTVLTEANATAGWVGLLAPLLMGAFLALGLSWRWGVALAVPMCLTLALAVRRGDASRPPAPEATLQMPLGTGNVATAEPAHPADLAHPADRADPASGAPLPRVLWIVMVAVCAAAGAEFAVSYWGATLLTDNTAASAGAVTAAMSAPVAGVAVGRTFGARLALRLSAHALLVGGWVVALLGFAVFWRAGGLPVAVLGLFVTGLGLSVLYPLLLDRAVLLTPERPERALALAYPFIGAAIGLAPFGLGALAAQVGVQAAFVVVPLIMIVGLGAVLASRPAPAADQVGHPLSS